MVSSKSPCVRSDSGFDVIHLGSNDRETVWLGKLAYELLYTASTTSRQIQWRLTGARFEAGDLVGRAPHFWRRDRLVFQPATAESDRARAGKEVVLWLDSMPSLAFEALSSKACGSGESACLRITRGHGRDHRGA